VHRRLVLTPAKLARAIYCLLTSALTLPCVHSWFSSENNLFRAVSYGPVFLLRPHLLYAGVPAPVCWLVLGNRLRRWRVLGGVFVSCCDKLASYGRCFIGTRSTPRGCRLCISNSEHKGIVEFVLDRLFVMLAGCSLR